MKLGVNTHFEQGYNQNEIAQAASFGASIIRDGQNWGKAETTKGVYDFSTRNLSYMPKAAAAGLGELVVFTGGNQLYDGASIPISDTGRQAYANEIVALLKQHPGQIQEIEVWNEFNNASNTLPDGVDRATAYTALLKTVYQTVKPLFPDVKILGDSVNVIATGLIHDTMKLGAGNYMDGVVIHPYQPSPENMDQEIAHLQSVMAADGKVLPIYATEFGSVFDNAADVPSYMLKAATQMASVHVAEADWYGMQDEPWFKNIGLVDAKGNLKPGADTFQFLTKQLLPQGDPVRVDTGDDTVRVFRYGTDTYVIWGDARGISFGQGGTFFDAQGHQIAAPTSIGDTPIIMKGTSYTLGQATVLADSLMEFGDSHWSYLAQAGTKDPVQAQLRDWNWNSYYTAIDPNTLSITQNGVMPAMGASNPINAIERYTAAADHAVQITGNWTPSSSTTDGVSLSILFDGKEIFSKTITSSFDLSGLYVDLKKGDTLDFVIGPNGSITGDSTQNRIQLLSYDPSKASANGPTLISAPTVGTSGADLMKAGDASAILKGLGGDDHLVGGKGDDTLMGGAGNNLIDGGAGNDTVSYADATAGVTVNLNQTATQTINSMIHDRFVSIENATGSSFADQLSGDENNNVLRGGSGDDVLVGGGGRDLLDGGAGTDTASWAPSGGPVNVSLAATGWQDLGNGSAVQLSSIENLTGSRFDDRLTGDAHDNVLMGGTGNDVIDGGGGNDVINGGGGSDTASFASAGVGVHVSLANGAAQDTGVGKVTLSAIENLSGSAFNDLLTGSNAANVLDGGAGNDTLVGGGGGDTLIGGLGADRFVFSQLLDSRAAAPDSIVGFNAAEGDVIDLSGIDANTRVSGDQAFHWVNGFTQHPGEISMGMSGDHWVVQADMNGDGKADFVLNVQSAAPLTTGSFVL